ncbi:MAG: hypothetical protein H0T53_14155 [Herpetosiphonaceae bacterium]|nr:hypothetical protein [Herpetosiphonaceae bacterium]
MIQIKEPFFILDKDGNQVAAVVDIESYNTLLDAVEDLNDIAAAESVERGKALPFDDAVIEIERMVAERERNAA